MMVEKAEGGTFERMLMLTVITCCWNHHLRNCLPLLHPAKEQVSVAPQDLRR